MKRISLIIIAVLGWFALIAQFYLHINSGMAAAPELITRFFSYFTIDTNILVALCCTLLLLSPASGLGKFFSKQTTITAITVYIVIVGVTYNLVLRSIWNPQGLQRVVDELLHLIIPILFLLYWLAFAGKDTLQWKHALTWMIYPLLYGAFVLIRGYYSDPSFYPYPFIDISKLGVNKGAINSIFFTLIFGLTSLLFIWIGKMLSKASSK